MPELPEVETVRRGLALHLIGRCIRSTVVRQRQLRYPISPDLEQRIQGQRIQAIGRRAKYLLIKLERGHLIWHLGMSGSLRILDTTPAAGSHDHIDIFLDNCFILRFCDPRKFGSVSWTIQDPMQHKLLRHLGPEPLSAEFNSDYLYRLSRNRKLAVKQFLMDSRVVAGVGNIYANEALFAARVHPECAVGRIARRRYERIVVSLCTILKSALRQGGTTLRNFVAEDGRPGYFKQALHVYQRAGEACTLCRTPIRCRRIAQRSSFYCPRCQH